MIQRKTVYLDNAATTPIHDRDINHILKCMSLFGNPSSNHHEGARISEKIEAVREELKEFLGGNLDDELIFTSGGTESNNLAIKGVAYGYEPSDTHIITSTIEHPSVLRTCRYLETKGYDISYVSVGNDGRVLIQDIRDKIKKTTKLISIMYVNNETGVIQPVREIGRMAKESNVLFHTDAVQAFGKLPINIYTDSIDILSFASHKINAPKGVGGLIHNKQVVLTPLLHGGDQENGLRPGTQNTLGILVLGEVFKYFRQTYIASQERLDKLRKHLVARLQETIPDITINGDIRFQLPNIVSISIKGVEAETIMQHLDYEGICVSKGSACTSNGIMPSHVLTEMGISPLDALGSIRISIGVDNTKDDIDFLMNKLPRIVKKARELSPLYHSPSPL